MLDGTLEQVECPAGSLGILFVAVDAAGEANFGEWHDAEPFDAPQPGLYLTVDDKDSPLRTRLDWEGNGVWRVESIEDTPGAELTSSAAVELLSMRKDTAGRRLLLQRVPRAAPATMNALNIVGGNNSRVSCGLELWEGGGGCRVV